MSSDLSSIVRIRGPRNNKRLAVVEGLQVRVRLAVVALAPLRQVLNGTIGLP